MDTKKISPLTLVTALGILIVTYYPLSKLISRSLPTYLSLGLALFVQITVILLLVRVCEKSLAPIGLSKNSLWPGIKKGCLWSLGFAFLALAMYAFLAQAGQRPLSLIRVSLPEMTSERIAFIIVGGLIAPVAEELFFRGLLFGYLRKWGLFTALSLSTLIFVLLHAPAGIPITQVVGGLVFALSYEVEKSLWTPIIIHASGNLALFACSMI